MSKMFKYRNIGVIGEDKFRSWCSSASLICNKADLDMMGWDFLVEFDQDINPEIPLDRQYNLKKALFQIKTTNIKSGSIRAKLSALKRLVDADMPSFIVQLNLGRGTEVHDARFLHIGEDEIATILKRIRESEAEGRFDLHNIRMTLSLMNALSINTDGSNLKQLISEAIGERSVDYIIKKSKYKNSCGYDGPFKGYFSFFTNSDGSEITDLLIGRIPELRVKDFRIEKTRFGIALGSDTDHFADGILRVELTPVARGRVRLINSDRGDQVELQTDVFAAPLPHIGSKKVRFANECAEIIVDFDAFKASFNFNIDQDRLFPIETISHMLKVGYILSKHGTKLFLSLEGKGELSVEVAKIASQFSGWGVFHEFAELISLAIFRHRRGMRLDTTLREIVEAFHTAKEYFSLLLRPGLHLTLSFDEELPSSVASRDTATLLVPVAIPFRSLTYWAIAKIDSAEIRVNSDSITVVGGMPKVMVDGVENTDENLLSELMLRSRQIAKELDHAGKLVIVPTFPDSEED